MNHGNNFYWILLNTVLHCPTVCIALWKIHFLSPLMYICIYIFCLFLLPEDIWCLWTSPDSSRYSFGQSKTRRIGSELGHSSQQIRELKLCHRTRWEGAAICWAPQVFLEPRTTFSHVVIHHLPPFLRQRALFGAPCRINGCDSEVRHLTCVFLGLPDLCAGVCWRSTH